MNEYSPKVYQYDIEGRNSDPERRGCTNFAYNTELFDRIIASGYNGDRTGMIGVMQQDNRVKDHVYTFVNNIQIVDSNGSGGVMAMGNLIYKSRTVYYLVPKLPNYKRTK